MSEELERGIPKAIVIDCSPISEEERALRDKENELLLKEFGILKENESMENMNRIR